MESELKNAKTDSSNLEEQIERLELLLGSYFRCDPLEEYNQQVGAYNSWLQSSTRQVESEQSSLETAREPLEKVDEELKQLDVEMQGKAPDASDPETVAEFNRLVQMRNALVEKHNALLEQLERQNDRCNEQIARHNQEAQSRQRGLEEQRENLEAYHEWIRGGGPDKFSSDVNRLYSRMHREKREAAHRPELGSHLERVRRIRRELGERARRREEESSDGLLVVEVTLCDSETCFMIVDNASSIVSIEPELVEVLDLGEHVGDDVEIRLPAGIRIKVPQLVIRKVATQGMTAEYVKGVVMNASQVGIDGCLGLSFLNRFDFRIERDRPQRLILTQKDQPAGRPAYDVFICHKSEDLSYAQEVFELLRNSGHHPFLSEESVESHGEADFRKTIDEAIEMARHLIVVGSSADNILTPWVEAEWGLFLALKRSGRKKGNLVNLLCGEMQIEELPATLSVYQAIRMDQDKWKSQLINFLPNR